MTSKSRETLPPSPIAGRYIVERVLGRGGMATVYLCTDKNTGTKVAVKVLREEVGSAVIVERFLREIEFASELDHPRIPKVLDTGVLGALPFYVMTYVEGESLRERLDRVKQLPVEEAVRITSAVIEPMTYAHRVGLVHRDIKPGNILVGDESIYVLDFGIARAIIASAEERLTSTGVAVGTPAYMSPEQALADGDLDARSDIYSLACVTYEMIAGIPPFVGATPQAVMARRFGSPPPPLSETREGVPLHVETAVSKALCRAPADRWQTAREFGDALTNPSTAGNKAVKSRFDFRRRTYGRLIGGLLGVVLVGVGIYAAVAMRSDHVARAERAVEDWDFTRAISELTKSVAKDPDNGGARVRLAHLMSITQAPLDDWKPHALRASDTRIIAPEDSAVAHALLATAEPRAACDTWSTVDNGNQNVALDILVKLAYADCLSQDRTVLAEASGGETYRFRASHHQAAKLYEGLLARNPKTSNAFAVIMPRLLRILPIQKNGFRIGTSLDDDPQTFVAFPALVSDTLAYDPVPIGDGAPLRARDLRGLDRAIVGNLARLRERALAWVDAAEDDADAHETLGLILESTGELSGEGSSALEQVARARKIAAAASDSTTASYMRTLRLGVSDVRLRLKLKRFAEAGSLADSILTWPEPGTRDSSSVLADQMVGALAALTGRVVRVRAIDRRYAAEYPVRMPSGLITTLPAEIGADANALFTHAAFGGPSDSITTISNRISLELAALFPKSDLPNLRSAVLRRPLSLAAPDVGPRMLASLGPTSDLFSNAVRGLANNDRRAARAYADSMTALHADYAPGEITMDAVLQLAWLLSELGDLSAASVLLDNAFRGLSKMPTSTLEEAPIAAALVRSMILRAELAVKQADQRTATEWSNAAAALWGRGDPEIRVRLRKGSN